MQAETIRKYEQPVPRYTSYPTAPHFNGSVDNNVYRGWLADIDASKPVSLYAHIPFCDQLCWYCGCNTKATRRYEPIAAYLKTLLKEVETVAHLLPARIKASHVHWGGGSPSILAPKDIKRLMMALREGFDLKPDAELAVELDPRHCSVEKIEAFAEVGFNRVSIGVQDFEPAVQAAINRHQSYDQTAATVKACRKAGIGSINVDLVYGLPHQTRDSVADTIERVLTLAPDRIALFGYAHLPSRLVHQRMIRDETLPGTLERFAQANRAASRLTATGYVRVGLDHFARPGDALVRGSVQRNFQGYTTDDASSLIGFGASAIGRFADGFVQNVTAVGDYSRRVDVDGLAVARGRRLTSDDKARGFVIARLLCDLQLSVSDVAAKFGAAAEVIGDIGLALIDADEDGLVEAIGTDGSFQVTQKGRLFLRSIAACFDAYLGTAPARHAAGV